MAKHLVIVESPAKAKTINKFLGRDYRVKASKGHVRDLPKNPKKKGDKDWIGVDEDKGFKPHYEILKDRVKTVDEIIAAAKEAETVLLAADPDREGEAICWHLAQLLREKKIDKPVQRILFNEITRRAVRAAIEAPREIDEQKVDAQEARRILDRIVGYRVSPLLWDRVRRGLSAGRVQTVALRMIVEREREITAFKNVEYWTVAARLAPTDRAVFEAKLIRWQGEDAPWRKASEGSEKQATLPDEAAAKAVVAHCSARPFRVAGLEAKRSRRNPPPPFTTSKLQQEASRRFRFPVARTMRLAQGLYEGKDLGELGTVGLITYMRTDSTRVAAEALDAVREHIGKTFGADYLPESPRYFRQSKSAQDAHEAIRPTSLDLSPERVRPHLEADEFNLYKLVWDRFVASQMTAAEFDVTTVDVVAGEALFRAVGQVQRFAGWLAVYQETREEDAEEGDEAAASLPALEAGETLGLDALLPQQNFTQPPPRFTEAMLVRALEENGIGRPSTYAAILGVLSEKDYMDKVEGRLKPTELGELVVDLLVKHFGDIFDVAYTARMEEELDKVEGGEMDGVQALSAFSVRFRKDLDLARTQMENIKRRVEKTDVKCEQCGAMMVKRWGRFGEFLACEKYPECKNTKELNADRQPLPEIDETCPNCGKPMALRRGKWGPFLACSGYPECKTTRKIKLQGDKVEVKKEVVLDEKCPECGKPLARKSGRFGEYVGCTGFPDCRFTRQEETGVACPKCGKSVVARRSKRGKLFYGCTGYPNCDFVLWKKPVPKPCPKCGSPYLLESNTKRYGARLLCEKEGCGHVEQQ
ncbi:MAG: type I DNA topoisomerase [Candidatus Polarisedimenticolia bacterium]|nr:type I DNA topoisomerase [bacterium]